ncbi:hypothetical protein B0A55_09211, partial [Friedmanniomyces simplex]
LLAKILLAKIHDLDWQGTAEFAEGLDRSVHVWHMVVPNREDYASSAAVEACVHYREIAVVGSDTGEELCSKLADKGPERVVTLDEALKDFDDDDHYNTDNHHDTDNHYNTDDHYYHPYHYPNYHDHSLSNPHYHSFNDRTSTNDDATMIDRCILVFCSIRGRLKG